MAQAKTSEDKSLANPSKQLDHEKILSNWDEYLAPAPMGIFIMSQLLICSTRVADFKINQIKNVDAINLIIHPKSFRTTLVQIANESYEVFMLAHTNMDKIQLQMAQVPDYVKECDKLLQSKKKNAIGKFLPRRLERIEEAAADGLKYSTQVRDAFDRLGRLIRQVILAVEASRGAKVDEIEELIRKLIKDEEKSQLKSKQREQDLLQKEREGAQEAVQRTQKNSEEASKWRKKDVMSLGTTFLARNATSYFSKKQAENWLQRIKQEAKQIEEERKKIRIDSTNSLRNLQVTVGKEVSTDEMIKLLEKGTKQLRDMHKNWAGMTKYFESINNYMDKVMNKYLVNFVKDANDAQDDPALLEFMDESIANSLSSSIKSHHVATTYVKVSDNYIMKPLNCMHGMLSIESHKLEETQDELLELCTIAMQGIQDMGDKDRKQTIREIENEVQNIQH